MSTEIIKVLDYLSSKIGITIDWTAENIWPQVTEFMSRYQVYGIAQCIFWVIASIGFIVFSVTVIRYACKNKDNEDSIFYDDALIAVTFITLSVLSIVFVVVLLYNAYSAIQWTIVPEIKIFETIQGYLGR